MERQSKRRRRLALSCIECRRRKIRCDRNDPCTHCVSVRIQCTFKAYGDEPVGHQQPQRDTTSGLSARAPTRGPTAEHGNQLLTAANSPSDHARPIGVNGPNTDGNQLCRPRVAADTTAVGHNNASNTLDGDENRSSNSAPDVESAIRDLLQRVQKLEGPSQSSPNRALAETRRGLIEHPSGQRRLDNIMEKSRSFGRILLTKIPQEVQSESLGQAMASTALC